ncbi:polar amino acid transport system ATP-binding protein [Trichococcus patagoniensis]|uniref:Polar amino acid transport system ATP-binding protein n=1 Tax=Trichococcus patagoniensis TaxID=382641 RepID=A0A2T5ILG8_9LACT|nr:YlbF family regulator [Trichococcus patagoniensis]PTQ84674.1 polar amino acid transport system ATP-binding protein [Trichococcus patagoniensis]
MTQELPIEGPAEAELNRLIEMLKKNEVIVHYQEAEENTKDNRALEQLVETIKSKQKEAAAFEHYAKPAAAEKTAAELAELNKQLKDSIAVQQYRDALWDANELLENVISIIQRGVDDAIEKKEA